MITLLLVGHNRCYREALTLGLGYRKGISVLDQGETIADVATHLPRADIVVVVSRPGELDVESVSQIRQMSPGPSVLVISEAPSDVDRAVALEAGASGVLDEKVGIDDVVDAVRRLNAGDLLHSAREMFELLRLANEKRRREAAARAAIDSLTPRECEILQLLACGNEVNDIAEQLFISADTVRTHINRTLAKLGTPSRLQAVLFAARYGAVSFTVPSTMQRAS